MKQLDEDELGENLWDDPLLAKDQSYTEIKPRVIDRFIHFLVDFLAAFISYWLGVVFCSLLAPIIGLHSFGIEINFVYVIFTYVLITTLSEGTTGRTLGKLFTNYEVVRENNKPITFVDALFRGVCRLIPFEFILMIVRDDERMAHDFLPKTKLILRRPNLSGQDDVIFDDTP